MTDSNLSSQAPSTTTPPATPPTPPPSVSRPAQTPQNTHKALYTILFLVVLLIGGFSAYTLANLKNHSFLGIKPFDSNQQSAAFELKTFNSPEEMRAYITESQGKSSMGGSFGGIAEMAVAPTAMSARDSAAPQPAMTQNAVGLATTTAPADRVSQTNVQVIGIDEPDVVKTNGKEIFFSPEQWWGGIFARSGGGVTSPMMDIAVDQKMMIDPAMPSTSSILPYPYQPQAQPQTRVLSAFPPESLAQVATASKSGQLLLDKEKKILSVWHGQGLTGYDIANPAAPKEKWSLDLDESSIVAARQKDGRIYLVLQKFVSLDAPCPIQPLRVNGQMISIPCNEIHFPAQATSDMNTTFTVMIVNPETGAIEKSTAFLGSVNGSTIYMSPNAVYVAYQVSGDMVKLLNNFINEKASDLVSQSARDRLNRLSSYELSSQSKQVELQAILNDFQQSLNKDDRLKFENEMQNRMKSYMSEHARELESTGLVKLRANDLSLAATGSVPGYLLNQFSMDEYQDNLRIATTFGGTWTQFGQAESASDVYVLDGSLNRKGAVTNLGKGERIYSVRFLSDKGYVVTFKQTDPFYVLDLNNASDPKAVGELKIPGYSSYLHPLTKDLVLGLGKENNQVKLSIFNVSNPSNPTEVSKYMLDEYWSEALDQHHAFLQDDKHEIFFFPGSKGGYVFSYKDAQLKLTKAVSDPQIKRAIYLNDYLYMLGTNKVSVLSENDWQVVKELTLN